jgi:hypothetical protein
MWRRKGDEKVGTVTSVSGFASAVKQVNIENILLLMLIYKHDVYQLKFFFECLIFTCLRRLARGEGEWEPPLSESFPGADKPRRGPGGGGTGCTGWCSDSRLLEEQSRSESLGATVLR